MDTSRLSRGQIIAAAGGLVMIVSLFLDWTSGVTITIGAASISTSGSAWDVCSGMDVLMALVGLAVIAIAHGGFEAARSPQHRSGETP
jgi:hypothetical protein